MYRVIYPEINNSNEFEYHTKNILQLKNTINKRYPKLEVEGYFARLDGNIDKII